MHKTDFSDFEVGTVFNKVNVSQPMAQRLRKVQVSYPSRLEAMALDPSKIAENANLVYEAGQIDLSVGIYKSITVEINTKSDEIVLTENTPRKALVMHAALLMQAALGFKHGLVIDVVDEFNLRHCGLGSSSSLIAGTAAAINELYGCPIDSLDLARYCAQNHGEEIDGDDTKLVPVQCIGGSAICGHFEGGLIILSGQATPIFRAMIPEDLSVIIGVPSGFTHPDSQQLMQDEIDNIEGFRDAGEKFGKEIAYRLVHEVMPALAESNLQPCKELLFDYRWDMGSIKNCSFVYPQMNQIADQLRDFKQDEEIILISLSSVGPGFFALTKNPAKVVDRFESLHMNTYVTNVHDGKYVVTAQQEV